MPKGNCCDKLGVLRERLEAMCRNHVEVLSYLINLKANEHDLDIFTHDLMIDRMDDIDYQNDMKLPENFICECKK